MSKVLGEDSKSYRITVQRGHLFQDTKLSLSEGMSALYLEFALDPDMFCLHYNSVSAKVDSMHIERIHFQRWFQSGSQLNLGNQPHQILDAHAQTHMGKK